MQDRTLFGLALAVAVLCAAATTAGPAEAQRRGFCGPVTHVGRNCITAPATAAGTRDFDITGARPLPRQGMTIAGTGRMRGFSPCTHANRHLVDVSWRRVAACPAVH